MKNGKENENRAVGEHECFAKRKGDGIKDFSSLYLPCQYLQLGECGCAPLDVHPFGLDPPTKPCKTENDCRILCSDFPYEEPQNLCKSFGGIEYWEGQNFANTSLFVDPADVFPNWNEDNLVLDIDIYA